MAQEYYSDPNEILPNAQTYGAKFIAPSAKRIGASYRPYDNFGSMGLIMREREIAHHGSTLDVNSHISSKIAARKSATSQVLRRSGIAVPKELIIPDQMWASKFPSLEDLRVLTAGEVVVKPDTGSRGRGVSLCPDVESALQAAIQLGEGAVLLQERSKGAELRVVTLFGSVIGGYWRRKDHEGFGNLSGSQSPEFFLGETDIPRSVRDASIQASKAIGLDYSGLDMILGDQGPVVLEVNASPMMTAAEGHSGGDIWSQTMMDTILDVILSRPK
jgi:glutathione synthase/RimK-type ligase-like ATP-grasp enzyme